MSKHNKKQYVQTQPTQQGRGYLSKFITFMGIISIFNAVFLFLSGFGTFQTQWDQTEWPVVTAQVVQVGHEGSSEGNTIQYEYQVDGTTYQGTTVQKGEEIALDSIFPVRYDPEHPDRSTAQVTLELGFLVQVTIFGVIAIVCLYGPSVYQKRKDRTHHRLPVR